MLYAGSFRADEETEDQANARIALLFQICRMKDWNVVKVVVDHDFGPSRVFSGLTVAHMHLLWDAEMTEVDGVVFGQVPDLWPPRPYSRFKRELEESGI